MIIKAVKETTIKSQLDVFLCCVLDCTARTIVAMKRGMRKTRNERIAVERGQQSTTEEHGQHKWMAIRYNTKTFYTKILNVHINVIYEVLVLSLQHSSLVKGIENVIDAILAGWPDGEGDNRGSRRQRSDIFLDWIIAYSQHHELQAPASPSHLFQ